MMEEKYDKERVREEKNLPVLVFLVLGYHHFECPNCIEAEDEERPTQTRHVSHMPFSVIK